jgi:hypothetical protein
MNRFSRDLCRGLKDLERDLDSPVFNWGGNDYACIPNESTTSKVLGLGGFELSSDLVLFVRKVTLPDVPPSEKQIIIYGGKRFRIDQVSMLPGGEVVRFTCNDPSKGV